jgi:hypothetical protein
MLFLTHPFALLGAFAASLGKSSRYEHLFSLSDADLARRGLNRDGLVRGFITGFAYG